MSAELVVVRTFGRRIDAELAHSALTAANIESFIRGDDPGIRAPVFLPATIELVVRESDAVEAAAVLGSD